MKTEPNKAMQPHLQLLTASVSLFSFGCVTKPNQPLYDPFASPVMAAEPFEVWRFIINPSSPQPEGTDASYADVSRFDLSMDPVEMAILRYLHVEGVDFMKVAGGIVSISPESQKALATQCLCHREKMKAVIFIRQTVPSLMKIKKLIESFGDEVTFEKVEIKEN